MHPGLPPSAAFRSLPSLTYCCIANEDADAPSPRYTQSTLRQTLQAMGCKPRHANKACAKLFLILQQRAALPPSETYSLRPVTLCPGVAAVSLPRPEFERLVLECLAPHDPAAQSASLQISSDLRTAMALQERHTGVAILLCGTSGTGKSTLASLLAARLGITTVVSTDSLRNMMRGVAAGDAASHPLLWVSTYQAGSALLASQNPTSDHAKESTTENTAVQGYLAQAEAVMAHVDRLVASAAARRESLVIEGVHLSPAFAARLMQLRPEIIVVPFLVHISNAAKHLERFAVRAKAMSLRPEGNRYVRHLRAIRDIQDHLAAAADRRCVPKVDNTNVDRSVAAIHATVLGCLRRVAAGEPLLDSGTEKCTAVLEEYLSCRAATWSSSGMLELIRKKVAAGEAVSPPDRPSTSAASTSVAEATPRGPLSEAGGVERRGSDQATAVAGVLNFSRGDSSGRGVNSIEASSQRVLDGGEEEGGPSGDGGVELSVSGGSDSEGGEGEELASGAAAATESGRRWRSDVGSVLETDDGRSELGEGLLLF